MMLCVFNTLSGLGLKSNMALYQPGQRSNSSFLISSIFSIILLLTIITGHLVLAIYLWFHFSDGAGMEVVSTFTGLPKTWLWLSIVGAFIMDIWVIINIRKGHQKAKRR